MAGTSDITSTSSLTTAPDTHSRPFRFLHLPLELQRLVLRKCYEEPYRIYPVGVPGNKGHYRTSISIAPLLVSYHFHTEVVKAIRESKSGAYFFYIVVQTVQNPAISVVQFRSSLEVL